MASVTYEKADEAVLDVVQSVMDQYHQDLTEVDLRLRVLMATAPKDEHGKPTRPAVKLHGVACAAVVRIISYKDRAAGEEDAEIVIDADEWEKRSEAERLALLDHEMTHLEVKRDAEGAIQSDDCGRPKLKMKLHDFQVGWFHSIAKKHGDSSYEVQQAKAFADENGQLYWGWSSPPDRPVESARLPVPGGDFLSQFADDLARKLRALELLTPEDVEAACDGDESLAGLSDLGGPDTQLKPREVKAVREAIAAMKKTA